MAGSPLQDLHAHRGVGPRVTDHPDPQAGEPALVVATGPIGHADGVSLGMHEKRLLARQRALDRLAGHPCSQRGMGLVRHVLLAAKGSAVGNQFDGDPRCIDVQYRGDLVPVVPYALTTRIDMQSGRTVVGNDWYSQRRLGLHKGVFDALGLEDLLDNVGRRG